MSEAGSSKKHCGQRGVRGLYNLGQSCYMNVILQMLLHNPLMSSFFLGDGHRGRECEHADCTACAFEEAFSEFYTSEKTEAFGAVNLLLNSWKTGPVSPLWKLRLHDSALCLPISEYSH